MKPTFLHQNRPLLTSMIQADTPGAARDAIRTSVYDGCDALGFQLEALPKAYRTDDTLRGIFAEACGRPIYVTNYRSRANEGDDDDTLAEGLLLLCRLGATLMDVRGDMYADDPLQLTEDARAVQKQKDLIARIHEMGGEVLMSSHTFRYLDGDVVMRIATAQKERGADIIKIVTASNSEAEELSNLAIIERLRHELGAPFLFLAGGSHCHLIRQIGPYLGSCMWLCVPHYDALATPVQPLLRSVRQLKDHFVY